MDKTNKTTFTTTSPKSDEITPREHYVLNRSNSGFKTIFDSGHFKFRYLPDWLDIKSELFKKEIRIIESRSKRHFDSYRRGTIVSIEFGVNVGSEMSGRHFGIVITKNDNDYNPIVQVIPLTSKKKKDYISIAKEVFENSVELLDTHSQSMLDEMSRIKLNLDELNEETAPLLALLDYPENNKNNFLNEELEKLLNKSVKKVKTLEKSFEKYQRDREMLEKIIQKYSVYSKDSYLCTKNLTTISKERIIKINRYDPSGTVKVSNETLDVIDQSLVSLYTRI